MAGLLGETVTLNARFSILLDVINNEPVFYTATWYSASFTVGNGVEILNLPVTATYTTPQGYTGTVSGTITVDVANSGYSVNFSGTQQPGDIYFEFTSLTGESIASVSSPAATNSGFTNGVNFAYDPYLDGTGITTRLGTLGMQTGVNLTQNVAFSFTPSASTNTAPVAVGNNYSVDEDNVLSGSNVLSNDSDADSDPLTAVLVSGPSNASSFTLNSDGTFTYTPAANFNGSDSFTYKANDGTADSNTVTVNITVNSVNDAPSGTSSAVSISEDQTHVLTASMFGFSDADGNAFAGVRLSSAPTHGTLYFDADGAGGTDPVAITTFPSGLITAADIAAGKLTFVPDANLNGTGVASFSFAVVDNGGTTGAGQNTDPTPNVLTFNITAINDAPTVAGDGTETALPVIEDMPGVGQTVSSLFSGQYSDAADNQIPNGGASSPGAFSGIAVVANDSSAGVGQWQYFSGGVWTDIGPASTASAKLISSSTLIRFNPATDYNGPAPSLTVHLIDNSLGFGIVDGIYADLSGVGATGGTTAYSTGTVVLSQPDIAAVNDVPVNTVPGAQTIDEDGSLTLSAANGNAIAVGDPDAWALSVTLSVGHGTLTLAGTAGLSFAAGDGTGDATMTFSGTVSAINAALDGLTYTPAANYNGSDAISVTTGDGSETDVDTVGITINAVNDAPVAGNDAFAIDEDVVSANLWTILLSNDTDIDLGDTRSIASVDATDTLGRLEFNAATQTLQYVADTAYFDSLIPGTVVTDTFKYNVIDSGGAESTATVTVTVTTTFGGTVITLGDGPDNYTGTPDEDHINGAGGNDVLDGLADDDLLEGAGGNDVLIGGEGRDTLDGGDGSDTASYRTAVVGVLASLGNPGANTGDAAGDSYIGIENLEGSGFDDVLAGNNVANDFLGGDGTDTVTYVWAGTGVVASLGNGTVGFGSGTTQTGEAAGDRYNSIEILEGSNFSDVLFAAAGGSTLRGLGGNDTLYGLGGADLLEGGAGQDMLIGDGGADELWGGDDNDTLRGDAGADHLYGEGGNDSLDGGAGIDVLNGGAGNDTYTGGGAADVFVIADLGGTDTITDFKRAQGDKIDLSSLNIDEWIGTQAFHNDAGEVRIRNAGSQWWLEGDTNGDGIADFSVAMGTVKLVETDLLIGPGLPA